MNSDDLLLIHTRDPDYPCEVRVFYQGYELTPVRMITLDPGAGYTKDDYDESRQTAVDEVKALGPQWGHAADVIDGTYDEWAASFEKWGTDWNNEGETA